MAGTDNHRNSGSRKVNMKIWGGVPSFSRNLSRHQLSCVLALWLLSYMSSMNAKTYNLAKKLMKYLVHRLLLTCPVLPNH